MLKLKIKIANIVFNSFTNDSRVIKESTSLAIHNYHVEVLAHLDKDLQKTEIQNNYTIHRFSYLDRTVTKSKLSKLRAYLLYAKECVNHAKEFDIIHCNDLNTMPIGFIIKKFYNKNVNIVYDAHEYETETQGLHGIRKKLSKLVEKLLIKYCDKVIVVSESIADEYKKLYPKRERPFVVLNTPRFQSVEKKDIFRETFDISEDRKIFLYQGVLAYGRGIETLLETFKNIDDDRSVVIFMGYGELKNLVQTTSNEYENIYFHEAVSPDILLNFTSSADFGISMIEDTCLSYRYCLPNKIFEYIMADVPVIVSNLPEMRKLIQESGIGVVAKENTPESLKDAIKQAMQLDKEKLYTNISKIKKQYNWQEQEKVLLEIYKEL